MALPLGSRRLTTIVTVSVVLVAGSAAALVNSQVLTRSTDANATAVPISLLEEPTTTAVAETVPTTVPATESTLSPTQSAYKADAAGQVVVDTDGGALSIVSVEPSDGFRVESMSQGLDPNNVSVFFRGDDGALYEFHAGLMGGVVGASIVLVDETSTTVSSGSGSSGSGSSGSGSSGSGSSGTSTSTATTVDDHGGDDDDDEDEIEEEDEDEIEEEDEDD